VFRLLYLAFFRESQCLKTYTAFLSIFVIRRWYNITIVRHQLDPDRPVPAAPNSSFKGPPSLLRPFALHFSCCSFLLHVAANLICVFLVFGQPALLSALPKFPHYFVVKKCAAGCSSEQFHLDWCQLFCILLSDVQLPLPHRTMGKADGLWTFVLEDLWIKFGLKVLFRINSCCENFVSSD
jgi:hypothetical protein